MSVLAPTMDTVRWVELSLLGCLVIIAGVYARGPVCLHGTGVTSPDTLTNTSECWPWESCFAEHYVDREGSQGFNFGCRVTQQCGIVDHSDPTKIILCEKCCAGDICNNDICASGTVPPRGLSCMSCVNSPTIPSCSQMTYCRSGEVCFAEKSQAGPVPKYNLGCLRKDVCTFFEHTVQVVGKRSVQDSDSLCHQCCETPGCNRDSCPEHEFGKTTTGVQISGTTPDEPMTSVTEATTAPQPARDCWDLRSIYNVTADGIYNVVSPSGRTVSVRCDMTTDGGGWMVFQKRFNGHVNFHRLWDAYKGGFGTLSDNDELWMGLDFVHEFTKDRKQKLRVDLCNWVSRNFYAEYNSFVVGPEVDNYRLFVAEYHGDASDALIIGSGGQQSSNNMMFSTPDADHDISGHNCAADYNGAWWFGNCMSAHLNGVYQHTGHPTSVHQGLLWRPIDDNFSFRGTEMKFRPNHVPSTNTHFSCPVH